MTKELLVIAGDHASLELKKKVIERFPDFDWKDLGTLTADSVDYPDYARSAAEFVTSGKAKRGVLICGSGIGMCIAANKVPGIRAAVVESVETARLSRDHNDANMLCLGARNLDPNLAFEIIKTWLSTPFSNSPRHVERIRKIAEMDRKLPQP